MSASGVEVDEAAEFPIITMKLPFAFILGNKLPLKMCENRSRSLGRYENQAIGIHVSSTHQSSNELKELYYDIKVTNAFNETKYKDDDIETIINKTKKSKGNIIGYFIATENSIYNDIALIWKDWPTKTKYHWYIKKVEYFDMEIEGFKGNQNISLLRFTPNYENIFNLYKNALKVRKLKVSFFL